MFRYKEFNGKVFLKKDCKYNKSDKNIHIQFEFL